MRRIGKLNEVDQGIELGMPKKRRFTTGIVELQRW